MEDEGSTYRIELLDESHGLEINADLLTRVIHRTLQTRHRKHAHINVALVRDERMAELNQRFLGHVGPTDVLTFPLGDDASELVEGDIVISAETAKRVADERGHDPQREILLYAVHGVLHLTGLDDATDEQAADMHALEDRILTEEGVGPVYGEMRS